MVDLTSPAQVAFRNIHQKVPRTLKGNLYEIGVPPREWFVIETDTSIVIFDELTGKPAIIIIRNVTAGCETGDLVRDELNKLIEEIVKERKGTRVCCLIHSFPPISETFTWP